MNSTPNPKGEVASLRILLVDDHAIVREGLKRMLSATAPQWTMDEASDGHEALARLQQQRYDVAILDISMPGMSGLDLLRRARADHPSLRVLMLSMHTEELYAMRAFKAGANGYVTKDSSTRQLVEAISKVIAGGTYVSPCLAERMVLALNGASGGPRHAQLSDREFDVLRRLAGGSRPSEIGAALHISTKTVSTHKSRIMERLLLPNTAALIRYAVEQGLVQRQEKA